jgi:uncharacterized membrane protein
VLEIRIAPSEFAHLRHALVEEWPGYLAYVTSFLTLGRVWIAHHNLFTRLRFADSMLLRLNLVLLMLTAFLPFPTGILAQALNDATEEAVQTAVVFYGLTALAMEMLLGALVRYADTRPVLTGDHRTRQAAGAPSRGRIWRISLTAGIYVVAIGVGLAVPDLAAVAFLVIAIRSVSITGRERSLTPTQALGEFRALAVAETAERLGGRDAKVVHDLGGFDPPDLREREQHVEHLCDVHERGRVEQQLADRRSTGLEITLESRASLAISSAVMR